MENLIYPPHIYDQLRRKIAQEFVRHELRKMFPGMRNVESWQEIDKDVSDWFENNNTMAPVRDFWNGFHGISRGFKLAGLVYRITSENIEWKEEEIEIEDLHFVTRANKGLEVFEQAPSVRQVVKYYNRPGNEKTKEELYLYMDDPEVLKVIRDNDPVLIRDDGEKRVIEDGNHRVLRRILRGEDRIKAYVGQKIANPIIYNYWVPTQIILDVLALARMEDNVDIYAKVIFDMIKSSISGQYEFATRSLNGYWEFDKRMYLEVRKLCEEDGIELVEAEFWG